MGEVCLADDLMLDRQVALKFLKPSSGTDAVDQLLAEARAAAALAHPFICSIYEISTVDERPCIAMEYVRGETLERRLRRAGALSLTEGLRVADEIAEALEAAHQRRVVHRDLKPANVMLTQDQHIKVMDFGLAARLPAVGGSKGDAAGNRAKEEAPGMRGTPAYMAPEQIRGEPADRRSDIFAFGILLYELLSGTNPFVRSTVLATLTAILDESPRDLHEQSPAIPATVAAVLARMMAKNPAARYQSFADVRMDLRRLAAPLSEPMTSTPPAAGSEWPRDSSAAPIGRDAERAQLLQSLNDAVSGRGALVVLGGEAGIGKTRMAGEVLEAARRHGCHTLVGRCYEQSGTPPLIPYIEVLEHAFRLMPASVFREAIGPSAPELATLLPELHRLFPELAPPMDLPPQMRQRFLFTNVLDFLTRGSRVSPLVILLDDLQWADEPTLQLTQHLAQHLSQLRILVVATLRDAEAAAQQPAKGTFQQLFDRVSGQPRVATPQAVKGAVNQLISQGKARMVALRPLTEGDVRDLLTALMREAPPPSLVRKFFDQTGGNPFFVSELFRHVKDEGLFDARTARRRNLELWEVPLPESVRLVLERRLQRVSAETQNVLKAAAIIGRDFELDLLEAIVEVDEERLMSALDEAEQARLLKGPTGRQDLTWRFTHQMICQAMTETMPARRRQRLHLRVAAALEQLDASPGAHVSTIAHHLYCAGTMADAARTGRALMAAGDAAHVVYATEEAIQHYRRALDVFRDSGSEATRRDVEEQLADLLALVGDGAEAMRHYQSVAGGLGAGRHPIDEARVTRKIGALHWQAGDRGEAMACYQRALKSLDGCTAHIEAARLYQQLGLAAFRSGDNQQAISWAERAVSSAEQALSAAPSVAPNVRRAATESIAQATNTIGVVLARSGELESARAHIERSLAAASESGLLDVACRAYANLGVLYSTVEPKRAIDVSLTGLELASKIGAASLQSYIYANLAAAYCALTERCDTEGLQAAQAAAALDRELGQLDHLAVPLIVIAQIHQCRGELQEAQGTYREALALAEKAGEPQLILPCYDGLATIHLDRGDRVRAAEYMEKARQLCDRTGLDPDTLLMLPFLS